MCIHVPLPAMDYYFMQGSRYTTTGVPAEMGPRVKSLHNNVPRQSTFYQFYFQLFLRINHESGQTICGLAWNPKGNNEIAYTDDQVMLTELCS